jgi:fimbrial chaperone protein
MRLASTPHRLLRRCAGAALLLAATSSLAATFSVTPVRIYMKPQDRAVAVTITNEGDEPVVLQADIYAWTQKPDGSDETQLTEDLILSPPIIKLGAKARQVVRLARLRAPDASRQLTYRMILREIPEAAAPKQNIQVQIALALSMPVFITPPPAKRAMSCTASHAAGGTLEVGCANTGSAYAQIREIQAKRGDSALARFEGGAYILPGARKVLSLKGSDSLPSGPVQLVVTYDDGVSESFNATSE